MNVNFNLRGISKYIVGTLLIVGVLLIPHSDNVQAEVLYSQGDHSVKNGDDVNTVTWGLGTGLTGTPKYIVLRIAQGSSEPVADVTINCWNSFNGTTYGTACTSAVTAYTDTPNEVTIGSTSEDDVLFVLTNVDDFDPTKHYTVTLTRASTGNFDVWGELTCDVYCSGVGSTPYYVLTDEGYLFGQETEITSQDYPTQGVSTPDRMVTFQWSIYYASGVGTTSPYTGIEVRNLSDQKSYVTESYEITATGAHSYEQNVLMDTNANLQWRAFINTNTTDGFVYGEWIDFTAESPFGFTYQGMTQEELDQYLEDFELGDTGTATTSIMGLNSIFGSLNKITQFPPFTLIPMTEIWLNNLIESASTSATTTLSLPFNGMNGQNATTSVNLLTVSQMPILVLMRQLMSFGMYLMTGLALGKFVMNIL